MNMEAQAEAVTNEETASVATDNAAAPGVNTSPHETAASPETIPPPEQSGDQVEGSDQTAEGGGEGEGDLASRAELELLFPEGVEVDEEMLEAFEPLAQEYGLDSEKAQKLVDLYIQGQQSLVEYLHNERIAQHEAWAEETTKTLGREFDTTIHSARRAIERFGTPGLVEALAETGAGNHPEVVAFVAAIGKALGEDTIAGGQAGPTTESGMERLMRQLYPTHYQDD